VFRFPLAGVPRGAVEEERSGRSRADALATIALARDGRAQWVEILRYTFEHSSDAPSVARHLASTALGSSPHLEVVMILVSELVTNTVMHTAGSGELVISRHHEVSADGRAHEVLHVEVFDHGDGAPVSPPTAGPEGGCGLRIVGAMARAWGWLPHPRGKIVWFEVGDSPGA
jgi:anti-sigma regulatory factor (Ser/Thr protein kinase)